MSPIPGKSLQGMVALVVGAGRPMGHAIALGLAHAGAAVAAHDLAPNHLEATRRAAAALGARCETYTGDTGKGLPARALVDDVLRDFARLDILIHCLHISPPVGLLALDEWDWQRTLELNLNGPFLLTQAAAPVMSEQGSGTIINVLATPPDAHPLAVSASQYGLAGLTQWAAAELLTYNIKCYAIEAGVSSLDVEIQPDAAPALPDPLADLSNLVVSLCTSESDPWIGKVIRLAEIA
jgi:3-oxoacyl-[acyl-carrier protein] reductase